MVQCCAFHIVNITEGELPSLSLFAASLVGLGKLQAEVEKRDPIYLEFQQRWRVSIHKDKVAISHITSCRPCSQKSPEQGSWLLARLSSPQYVPLAMMDVLVTFTPIFAITHLNYEVKPSPKALSLIQEGVLTANSKSSFLCSKGLLAGRWAILCFRISSITSLRQESIFCSTLQLALIAAICSQTARSPWKQI